MRSGFWSFGGKLDRVKGRRPKATSLKVLEGNRSHRPPPEPALVSGRPLEGEVAPPEHLPPDAKDFWKVTVNRLIAAGVVDSADLTTLELLSAIYARARDAQRASAEQGRM